MRALVLVLLAATPSMAPSPTPAPSPPVGDATPAVRGAVTTGAQSFGGRKRFVDGLETSFIDAGALLINGSPPIAGADGALVVNANRVSCTMAASGQAGCMSTATQFFTGSKVFETVSTFLDSSYTIDPNTGSKASVLAVKGMAVGDAITTESQGQGLILVGRRAGGDTAAGVLVRNSIWVDAGVLFGVNSAYPCNTAIFTVSSNAVGFGASSNRDCSSNGDAWNASFVDTSTLSGHVALQSATDLYLSIGGRLTDNHNGILPDGGRPDAGGYPEGWVAVEPDGGSYFTYAGFHGNVAMRIPAPYYGASLFEWHNPLGGGIFTDHVAGVSWLGGYWQAHGKTLAQFPSPVADNVFTNLGQYRHMVQSTMLFDFSDSEGGHRWYYAHVDPLDGGSDWTQFAHQAPVYGPPIFVNAALVAAAQLGQWQTPSTESLLFDALQIYIGTAGSGGSSNATLRFTDSTGHSCDFVFPCNSAAGAYRLASSGDGCGPERGTKYTITVASLGACTGGGAPVLTGNIAPEFRWR